MSRHPLTDDDPMLDVLMNAPEGEPMSDEERVSIEEAVAAYERGEVVTDAELRRRYGW